MKIIILPNKEEMLKRLMKVSDNSHLNQKFYPLLLESAGKEIAPQGVVMMFAFAINKYVEGMPQVVEELLYMYVPDFITALINDVEVAEQIKNMLKEALD